MSGDALFRDGEKYYFGEPTVPVDLNKAKQCFAAAAEFGHAGALFALGVFYEKGLQGVVQKDFRAAATMYEKAAAAGHVEACFNLGFMHKNGLLGPPSHEQALKWYGKAAEKGDVDAMLNIGLMHANGEGVSASYKTAKTWYEKAAEKGSTKAMVNLGVMFEFGQGVMQDLATAKSWYERGAEKGDAVAMANVGELFYNGLGVARDKVKAKVWFEKAVAAGEKTRAPDLLAACSAGTPVTPRTTSAASGGDTPYVEKPSQASAASPQAASSSSSSSSSAVLALPESSDDDFDHTNNGISTVDAAVNFMVQSMPSSVFITFSASAAKPNERTVVAYDGSKPLSFLVARTGPTAPWKVPNGSTTARITELPTLAGFEPVLNTKAIDSKVALALQKAGAVGDVLRIVKAVGLKVMEVDTVKKVAFFVAKLPLSAVAVHVFGSVQMAAEANGIAKAVVGVIGIGIHMALQVRANNRKCEEMSRQLKDLRPALLQLVDDLSAKGMALMEERALSDAEANNLEADCRAVMPPLFGVRSAVEEVEGLIESWTSTKKQKSKFVRGVKKMITAGSVKEDFEDALRRLATAVQTLQTALATRTFLKVDMVLKAVGAQTSEAMRAMQRYDAQDCQQFSADIKLLMERDAEFRVEMEQNYKELRDHIARNFKDLGDTIAGVVKAESEETRKHIDALSSKLDAILAQGSFKRVEESSSLVELIPGANGFTVDRTQAVGAGSFGTVYLGSLQGVKVAVKAANGSKLTESDRDFLLREAKNINSVRDTHVVNLFGVVRTPQEVCLVMVYHSPDLYSFISAIPADEYDTRFPPGDRLLAGYQICLGMTAVHKAGLLHHDLRAANVLVGTDPMVCKISDFGSAKVDGMKTLQEVKSNVRFSAPEYLTSGKGYTVACDIFSFGSLMYEVQFRGVAPYQDKPDAAVIGLFKAGTFPDDVNTISDGLLRKTIQKCWNADLTKRFKTFESIADALVDDISSDFFVNKELEAKRAVAAVATPNTVRKGVQALIDAFANLELTKDYSGLLSEHGIDLSVLKTLTSDDLKNELGIAALGDRSKIMRFAKDSS